MTRVAVPELPDLDEMMEGDKSVRSVDRKGRPVPFSTALWLQYEHPTYARIGDTYWLAPDYPPTRVSTVWLGPTSIYERAPFETMVFSELTAIDAKIWRYPTLRAAEIGHRLVVRAMHAHLARPVALAKHARGWR